MQRWISREGAIVERCGVPVIEFRSACSNDAAERAGFGCATCTAGSARRLPVGLLDLDVSARLGDRVAVRVGAGSLNRIAAACFAVPLAALLAGAGLGRLLTAGTALDADVASGLVGLGCLALAFMIVGRNGGALLRMLELDARLEKDG
jgi:positive regulator of sigma E activity